MMNTQTGEFRMLTPDDFLPSTIDASPVLPAPGEDEVLVQGTEADIERLSDGIRALNREERRKAKRKAQRAARKANR